MLRPATVSLASFSRTPPPGLWDETGIRSGTERADLKRFPAPASTCVHRLVLSHATDETREGEDAVGAMLPGQIAGVGRSLRAGAVLVLHFPRLQGPQR